jgi:hypothetical protein
MKTILHHQPDKDSIINQSDLFQLKTSFVTESLSKQNNNYQNDSVPFPTFPVEDHTELITPKALYQMTSGELPDLWEVCYKLYHTFFEKNAPYSALQFIPVLKNALLINPEEIERFLQNPETNHVLMQNELLKIVLIHWKPGKYSDVHGHPVGGCVFKVLQGRIEEKRYTPDQRSELLAVSTYAPGGLGYIDDQMAYHAVGNPFSTSAISLHVYTPGLKKANI